ncbi:hypothetical protein D3C84_278570 [compost metagenome]
MPEVKPLRTLYGVVTGFQRLSGSVDEARYEITSDERLKIDVVEFHDDQRHYQFDVRLPYHPQAGMSSSDADGVWNLQTRHQVVEKHINFRAYHYRDARAWLDGEVDQTRGASSTYGEAYHYGEPYTVLGDRLDQDEDLQSESGFFYSRPSPTPSGCVFAQPCWPSRRSPAACRRGSPAMKPTTPTVTSTWKAATRSTSCLARGTQKTNMGGFCS